ncbi:MAG: hypothetical protein WCV90_02385 [Candidatus Woesearchaeota archaeon]
MTERKYGIFVCSGNQDRSPVAEMAARQEWINYWESKNQEVPQYPGFMSMGTSVSLIQGTNNLEHACPGTVSLKTQMYGIPEALRLCLVVEEEDLLLAIYLIEKYPLAKDRYANEKDFRRSVSRLSSGCWESLNQYYKPLRTAVFKNNGINEYPHLSCQLIKEWGGHDGVSEAAYFPMSSSHTQAILSLFGMNGIDKVDRTKNMFTMDRTRDYSFFGLDNICILSAEEVLGEPLDDPFGQPAEIYQSRLEKVISFGRQVTQLKIKGRW